MSTCMSFASTSHSETPTRVKYQIHPKSARHSYHLIFIEFMPCCLRNINYRETGNAFISLTQPASIWGLLGSPLGVVLLPLLANMLLFVCQQPATVWLDSPLMTAEP